MFRAKIKSYPEKDVLKFHFPSLEEEKKKDKKQAGVVPVPSDDVDPEIISLDDVEPEILSEDSFEYDGPLSYVAESGIPPADGLESEASFSGGAELEILSPDGVEREIPLSGGVAPEILPADGVEPAVTSSPSPPERSLVEIEREAYEKGMEEGRRAGAESVKTEAAGLLSGVRAAVAGIRKLHDQVVREAESQVVELAIAIARRILIGELSDNPARVVDIVKEAIRRIERTGPVTIRVHPDLSDAISSLKGRSSEFQTDILLDVDPSVPVHGPIIVGATEEVLTDIDEQIRVISEELRSERASH
ncbi:MAG: FliH/SctL family protein [Syntrophorhabdaceae bacterium]|nr:FliH/SctL family protein [Syntrophorhabdaceae bacterium]